jgi:ubiquitin-conjugating enzyme E2 G1
MLIETKPTFDYNSKMAEAFALERLRKEFGDLCQNEDIGFSVGLENDNFLTWNVFIQGESDTLYEGGYYSASLEFTADYPNQPPEMRFRTEMWHPNIYPDGKVCISILHPPGTDAFNE